MDPKYTPAHLAREYAIQYPQYQFTFKSIPGSRCSKQGRACICKRCGCEIQMNWTKNCAIHNERHDIADKRCQLFMTLINQGLDEYVSKEITQIAYPLNKK